MSPVRRYIQGLNDQKRMKTLYPHHPKQTQERIVLIVLIIALFAGLFFAAYQTAKAAVAVQEEEQRFVDFLNRKFVLASPDGHTVYAEKIEIGEQK